MKKNLYVHYKDLLATRQQKEVYGNVQTKEILGKSEQKEKNDGLVLPDADIILTGIQDHPSFENKLFNRSLERVEVVEYFGLGFETGYIEPPNSISDHITLEAQQAVYENLSTFSGIQKFDIELQFNEGENYLAAYHDYFENAAAPYLNITPLLVESISVAFITKREDAASVGDFVALQPAKFFEEVISNTESYFFNIFPGVNEDLQTFEQLSYSFGTSQSEEGLTVDLVQISTERPAEDVYTSQEVLLYALDKPDISEILNTPDEASLLVGKPAEDALGISEETLFGNNALKEESSVFTEILSYSGNQSIADIAGSVETVLKIYSTSFTHSFSNSDVISLSLERAVFDSASTAEVKNMFLTNYLLTPTTYFSEEYIGTRISL